MLHQINCPHYDEKRCCVVVLLPEISDCEPMEFSSFQAQSAALCKQTFQPSTIIDNLVMKTETLVKLQSEHLATQADTFSNVELPFLCRKMLMLVNLNVVGSSSRVFLQPLEQT